MQCTTKKGTVKMFTRAKLGESGNVRDCLIFQLVNYYVDSTVFATDS